MRVALKLGDKPGQLAHALARVAETDANILEVHHDRTYSKALVGDVGVELTLETRNFAHQDFLMRFLEDAGFLLRRI
jgi:threonine dehydratase